MDKTTESVQETHDTGYNFSNHLKPGHVVGLFGELGSGKTTFIRGICSGLQVKETVTSPTFTIMNEYHARVPIYHFDFYRISSRQELSELGLEEYFFGDGITLVEWPEIACDFLPKNYFKIFLNCEFSKGHSNSRHIKIIKVDQELS
jgi:tRNA threonylcarbamoyladenosine biosynthesis protein TsaE